MYITSDLHKSIFSDPAHVAQSKVTIAGTDYMSGEGGKLWDLSITGGLFAEDRPAIGGAVAREIDLELLNPGEIPRMAKIEVYARVALVDADTGETISAAEWIPKGVFYIATRSIDASGEFLTIHGYDAMLMGEQAFLDQESGETGLWPQSMSVVAAACAAKMGVEIDPRTVISSDYTIGYPTDYTCRELLQHIAAAHAGNWTISCEGKLWLRPLVDADADTIDIGSDAMDLSSSPELAAISMVRLWTDDEHCYEAGDGTGRMMEADCPWASQAIADAVLDVVRGLPYVPIEVTDAFVDPAVELGDLLTVTGITSPIGSMTETFGADYSATVSAPADDDVDNEYPYTSSTSRKYDRKLAQTKSEIMVALDSIVLRVTDASGVTSEVKLTEAGKIDLTGYATFQGLSEGTTVIDGGCIKADTKIESPIIVGGTIYAGTPDNMLGYLKMVNDGLEVYNKDGLLKARIGYTSSDLDYPYIQLGSGNSSGVNSQGIVKKFVDGLWIGNGAALEASGNFSPQDGYNGIFVRFSDGQTYVIHDTAMQNVYTGDSIARFG